MKPGAALRFYLHGKATSVWRYAISESLQGLFAWMPSIIGVGLRAAAYKLMLHADGFPAIEDHVRIARPEDVWLGAAVYIDHGVYLHGGKGGLHVGAGSWIMNGCRLHVFNFRDMPHSGIRLGKRTFIGEGSVMRGQGGIRVGDNVLFGPRTQVLAVDHVFTDPNLPIMDQGITAQGIVIEENCWIGAGAIVLDGVTIGRGTCVGAGAVVTKSLPPHSLAVGVPARVIRNLLSDPMPAPTSPVFRGGMDDLHS
jgi:carbonic anhydrase/acetyltransferase-like protein (isoleucine patch superfamily)